MSDNFFSALITILMSFSGASIPTHTTGWSIAESWKTIGNTYYFEAQSESIIEQCRKQPLAHINFPVIIQSAHRVLVDGQLVAKFGDPTFRTVDSYYGTPHLTCRDIPPKAERLVWQVFSSTEYFSHFSSMPSVEEGLSFRSFFNETLAIIAAGTLLVLAIFCFTVFYRKISLTLTVSLVVSCSTLSIYFIASNAKYFGLATDLMTTLKISDSALWIGILLFIYCLHVDGLLGKIVFYAYAAIIGISEIMILSAANADAEQDGSSLPFMFSIVILAVAFYKVTGKLLRKEGLRSTSVLQALSYGIFFVACVNDSFVVMGLTESYMMLPIGILGGILFFSLAVNHQITITYLERDHLRLHLEDEVKNKTQDLTIARDQALMATKAKDSFLANMSHEIRTPLTAIIGFAEYAITHDISDEERLSAFKTIVSSGNHLLAIINDILDFSKIEANSIEIEFLEVNPCFISSEVQSLVMPLADKKGLFIKVDCILPLPVHIISDAVRLRQILLNVCSNAIKFTEKGGITLTQGYNREKNLMHFHVKDTGIGMNPEQIAKIFEPFKQADSSITRRFGGTGLGLSLSKRLARLLGGDIQVVSEPGVGSEFIITIAAGDIIDFPLLNDLEQLTHRTAEPAESAAEVKLRGQVLLAEDNENNQKLLSLYLNRMGLKTTIADDGDKALALASAQEFDLIFMDMQMPLMSGIDAVKLLRKQGYSKPIVALTANATKEDRDQCMSAGCNDFVTKPVTRDRFYQTAARFLPPAVESNPSNEPIISALLEDEPEMADIVLEFTHRLPGIVDTIHTAFREKDWQSFKHDTHTLKGMGGGFGYPQVTELAANLEIELANHNLKTMEIMVKQLENLATRITVGIEPKK